jgi:hypothetical protein
MLVLLQVMLYDDEEGDCITPEDVWDVLEEDLAVADAVLWLGISFEQSASTEYFRKVGGPLWWCYAYLMDLQDCIMGCRSALEKLWGPCLTCALQTAACCWRMDAVFAAKWA